MIERLFEASNLSDSIPEALDRSRTVKHDSSKCKIKNRLNFLEYTHFQSLFKFTIISFLFAINYKQEKTDKLFQYFRKSNRIDKMYVQIIFAMIWKHR